MEVKSLVVEAPAHAIRQRVEETRSVVPKHELTEQKGTGHLNLGSQFGKEKSDTYTTGIENRCLTFSNRARFCCESHFLRLTLKNLFFLKTCSSLMDT